MDSFAAQQLTDIKFTEKKKGYDPEEVDNFLEKLGDAVVKLQEKVKEATRRADDAEARAASAVSGAPRPEDDAEVVGRAGKTLLMAQKVADEVTEAATKEAEKAEAEARQKATRIIEDANRDSANKLADAETELQRITEDQASVVKERTADLETQRDELLADVESLEEHLELLRGRVRTGVDQLSELLEHPENFRPTARPDLKTPGRPPVVGADPAGSSDAAASSDPTGPDESADSSGPTGSDEPVDGDSEDDTPADPEATKAIDSLTTSGSDDEGDDAPSGSEQTDPASAATGKGTSLFAGDDGPEDSSGAAAEASTELPTRGGADESASGGSVVSAAVEDGRVTTKAEGPGSTEAADDGFLDELKKAVTDDSPLGPSDEKADAAMRAFFDGDPAAAEDKKGRFGRKR